MPITHIASVAATGNPATTFTLTIPAATQANDVLILVFTSRNHTSTTAQPTVTDNDTGGNTWTRITNSTDRIAQIFWKRATSGTASKTVTVAGCVNSTSGVLSVFRGATLKATPYSDLVLEANASGDTTHAGFTPTYSQSMTLFAVYNYNNDNSVSNVSQASLGAMTLGAQSLSTAGSDCGTTLWYRVQTGAPQATGNITWTQTAGTTYSISLALFPDIFGTLTNNVASVGINAVGSFPRISQATLTSTLGTFTASSTSKLQVKGLFSKQTDPLNTTAISKLNIKAVSSKTLDNVYLNSQSEIRGVVHGDLVKELNNIQLISNSKNLINSQILKELDSVATQATSKLKNVGSLLNNISNVGLTATTKLKIYSVFSKTVENIISQSVGLLYNKGLLQKNIESVSLSSETKLLGKADFNNLIENVICYSESNTVLKSVLAKEIDFINLLSETKTNLTASSLLPLDSTTLTSESRLYITARLNKLISSVSLLSSIQITNTASLSNVLENSILTASSKVKIKSLVDKNISDVILNSTGYFYYTQEGAVLNKLLDTIQIQAESKLKILSNTYKTLQNFSTLSNSKLKITANFYYTISDILSSIEEDYTNLINYIIKLDGRVDKTAVLLSLIDVENAMLSKTEKLLHLLGLDNKEITISGSENSDDAFSTKIDYTVNLLGSKKYDC